MFEIHYTFGSCNTSSTALCEQTSYEYIICDKTTMHTSYFTEEVRGHSPPPVLVSCVRGLPGCVVRASEGGVAY